MNEQLSLKTEKISQDGNIRIIEDQEGRLYIWFGDQNTTDFLPQDYYFVSSEHMRCDHNSKQVEVDIRELDDKGFLLTVFHEAGHANRDTDDDIKKNAEITAEIRSLGRTPEDDTRYTEIFKDWVEVVERRERNAWLYSLDIAQQLIDHGFDVRTAFQDLYEFKRRILRHHNSYRSGMKYVYERSNRGTGQQWLDSDAYVDQVFDQYITALESQIKAVWGQRRAPLE